MGERPTHPHEKWLAKVADAASDDAGGVPAQLLGEYLPLLAEAALTGRRTRRGELAAVTRLGRQAAERGISAGGVVQLYLSAARRLWHDLPAVARDRDRDAVQAAAAAVLQVLDDAVATLAEGYAVARRDLVRREEALRREVIDDLLRGDPDLGALVERVEPFGLDLARAHRVTVAVPGHGRPDTGAAVSALEAMIFDRLGDRDVLVAAKQGMLVVIAPADTDPGVIAPADAGPDRPASRGLDESLGRLVHRELSRPRSGPAWRVAVGRAHAGVYGIARSYEEAHEALDMAARLQLDNPVVNAEDLLLYRVLLRDQPAMVDLVHAVLSPLCRARGGARPLLETLSAYFETGGVATEAARRLHVAVRTVTYRLARVKALTGYDPADPDQRFALQAAVLGARALDWPARPLPAAG